MEFTRSVIPRLSANVPKAAIARQATVGRALVSVHVHCMRKVGYSRTKRRQQKKSLSKNRVEKNIEQGQNCGTDDSPAAADEKTTTNELDSQWPRQPSASMADKEQLQELTTNIQKDDGESASYVDLLSPSHLTHESNPPVSRDQILSACASTSVALVGAGLLLRKTATNASELLGTDRQVVESLLSLESHIEWSHLAVVLVVVLLVTFARRRLLALWPDFARATNTSNKQVLLPLGWFDILLVSFLAGTCEEFVFRGSLIPALYPDWRGVLISGVAFGLLHNSGGRNWAFAGWASVVGCIYGFSFLYTQDLLVPMAAHTLANVTSASLWLQDNSKNDS